MCVFVMGELSRILARKGQANNGSTVMDYLECGERGKGRYAEGIERCVL